MKVVAIGASAGGIEAFRLFFESLTADSGMAFVVVLHLSANHKSMLAGIIARWTKMPVSEAADQDVVEPNRVYVIPAGHVATIREGRLHLRPLAPDVPREATPIDEFFDSMASDLGEDAIGVVLSGTGHDGALGLKAIKTRGGITIAQGTDGTGPQHDGMPSSAIATGAVDLIVPVEDMPRVLLAAKAEREASACSGNSAESTAAARLRICDILRMRLGHDFSHYKDKTFVRRVQRRMQVLGVTEITDYVARLEADRDEAVMLFRDLLIGVTTFFRDAGAFEAVRRVVIPRLFDGKGASASVRVWVPGCATGEEAYSLAMLLREYMDGLSGAPKVQVFATDIDERAIGTARTGRYPATLLNGLSPERRERFFSRNENSFVVAKEVRDLCTFSAHSLVRDPPFSRMNLVSCRNLLIYMDTDLQGSVIPAFHYSLLPGGILLLGSAETVTRHDGLFMPLEKEHRIYLRRDGPSPPIRVPARLATTRSGPLHASPEPQSEGRTDWARALAVANSRVLERFASPFAVITDEGTVIHYSSHVGSMLQPALGPPSRSIFEMARRGLRHGLRLVVRSAVETGRAARQSVLAEGESGELETVDLIVEPLPGQEPDRPYLVVFRSVSDRTASASDTAAAADGSLASELNRDLRDAQERLQSLNEEHETALEELRSSNEELHSVNEELQSSNEELETSKEEIQSINEELQTVNAQLSTKIDELDRANSDLRNLFESTRVATIFLDSHLVIRAFTPEVASIYNLIPSDRGRPLTDIVSRLDYTTLRDDVQQVLRSLEPQERRVSRQDGTAHYLLQILPYRSPDSKVDGSLVTFVDVTRIVQAEQHQRLLVDELNHRVKNMLTVVISLATQTLKRAATLEEFSGVFLGRVHALTSAYALLSRENWSSVQLAEIVIEELRPFMARDRANVKIEGPSVPLDPRGALALGMAIHELATNAAKYGALSVSEGDVAVTWSAEHTGKGDTLVLSWTEQNGPPVTPPAKRGFGTVLIERGLAHDLSGTAQVEFLPSGVRAVVRAPLRGGADGPGSPLPPP
ncbi:MAG: chemotaxis protein CheB [Acetobacteraceae bacterium]|nr:chemotaxis protein CheB [Acetobacteraceae bacterium]